jgi:hypothetical protein
MIPRCRPNSRVFFHRPICSLCLWELGSRNTFFWFWVPDLEGLLYIFLLVGNFSFVFFFSFILCVGGRSSCTWQEVGSVFFVRRSRYARQWTRTEVVRPLHGARKREGMSPANIHRMLWRYFAVCLYDNVPNEIYRCLEASYGQNSGEFISASSLLPRNDIRVSCGKHPGFFVLWSMCDSSHLQVELSLCIRVCAQKLTCGQRKENR